MRGKYSATSAPSIKGVDLVLRSVKNLRGWLNNAPVAPVPDPEPQRNQPPQAQVILLGPTARQSIGVVSTLILSMVERDPDVTVVVSDDADLLRGDARSEVSADRLRGTNRSQISSYLQKWSPNILLQFLSDYNDTLATEAVAQGAKLYLICDHLPPQLPKRTLQRATGIFAASGDQVMQLRKAGLPDHTILLTGHLSDGVAPPPCDDETHSQMLPLFAGRPVWLAMRVPATEMELVIAAHSQAARLSHRLMLVLTPADLDTGDELAQDLRKQGWRVAQRSKSDLPDDDTQIFLADAPDEDGMWFRLSPITLMGGTMSAPRADTREADPMGPAGLGSAILHGPRSILFRHRYTQLTEANAAHLVFDQDSLARALDKLIAPDKAALLAHNAWEVATEGAEATERVVSALLSPPQKARKT